MGCQRTRKRGEKSTKATKLQRPGRQIMAGLAAVCYITAGCLAFRIEVVRYLCTVLVGLLLSLRVERCYKSAKWEQKRYEDVCSYMQQFSGAILLRKRVLPALEDVRETFAEGEMRELLDGMIRSIYEGRDFLQSQRSVLEKLQKSYENPEIGLLHEFALRVEEHGGEFEQELKLIDESRNQWMRRTQEYQQALKLALSGALLLHCAMLFVCAFVVHSLPESVSIVQLYPVQNAECAMLLCVFVWMMVILKKRKNGWLRKEVSLSEACIDRLYARAVCGCFPVRVYSRYRLRAQMKRAFPRWLFDVSLLMQKNSIPVSIAESLSDAPYVLKREIRQLLLELEKNPSDIRCYLSFLEEYRIPDVQSTMRMLVALQQGVATESRLKMEQFLAHNMELLAEEDAAAGVCLLAGAARFYFYPMIPTTILMILYCVEIIVRVFQTMSAII